MVELLTTYNELNSTSIDELTDVPSALEFMRYVARNRPFVVRGGASDWQATRTWDVATLKELLGGQSVNVAVTPEGYVRCVRSKHRTSCEEGSGEPRLMADG
jgi:jumonji domain-containing protein 7